MNEMQSFKTIKPVIERIAFRKQGYMSIELEDRRTILVPLIHFPGISALTPKQRRQYQILDDTILMFRDDDEAVSYTHLTLPTKA